MIATNSYDALNRKVKVVANSTTTDRLFSSNWQLLEEKVGSNTKTSNVWSPVYVDAMVSRDRDTDANGTLDERFYALQDANFNVTAITNTSGAVQEKYTETPFGVTTFRNSAGSTISVSTKDWTFLHQGGQADVIGDLDFRNRVLSPALGRWMSNDPTGFDAGDVNFYRYGGNDPGNSLDSFGLQVQEMPPLFLGGWKAALPRPVFPQMPGPDPYSQSFYFAQLPVPSIPGFTNGSLIDIIGGTPGDNTIIPRPNPNPGGNLPPPAFGISFPWSDYNNNTKGYVQIGLLGDEFVINRHSDHAEYDNKGNEVHTTTDWGFGIKTNIDDPAFRGFYEVTNPSYQYGSDIIYKPKTGDLELDLTVYYPKILRIKQGLQLKLQEDPKNGKVEPSLGLFWLLPIGKPK